VPQLLASALIHGKLAAGKADLTPATKMAQPVSPQGLALIALGFLLQLVATLLGAWTSAGASAAAS
jgi:hypothetical protein